MKWNLNFKDETAGNWMKQLERDMVDFQMYSRPVGPAELAMFIIQKFLEEKPAISLREQPAQASTEKPARDPFIERLEAEVEDLAEKHAKLANFFNTQAFSRLPEHHRMLLTAQHTQQHQLLETLSIRLSILREEERAANLVRAAGEEVSRLMSKDVATPRSISGPNAGDLLYGKKPV